MLKNKRKLKEELFQKTSPHADSLKTPCLIEQKLSCCDGLGIQRKMQGAYLQVSLCDCVRSCPSCFGRARKLIDGQSRPCREPNPSRIVNILNQALIPARYAGARLENFTNYTGNGKEVIQTIRQWLQDFRINETKGLLIGGPVGVGKTYLLASIAKILAYRAYTIRFVDFFQLLNELKAGYANDQADASTIQQLIDVDILVIDELGKGRNNDWELSIIDQLVMGRYNQNKMIIASTNYGFKTNSKVPLSYDLTNDPRRGFELDHDENLESRVGARIFSRLVESCHMIDLSGEDYRKRYLSDRRTSHNQQVPLDRRS